LQRIVVITSDGPLNKIQLPLPLNRLEAISRNGGMNAEEEAKVCSWCLSVSVAGVECGVSEEVIKSVLSTPGKRTTSTEDTVLAEWVLRTWAVIESLRHRA
jgi:hypothetical protein